MECKSRQVTKKWIVDGKINGTLLLDALSSYCCQIVDFVLQNRFQTPELHVAEHFLNFVDEAPEQTTSSTSLGRRRGNFNMKRMRLVAENIRKTHSVCAEVNEALNYAFMAHIYGDITLKEVDLVIGPVLNAPREIYRIMIPPRHALVDADSPKVVEQQTNLLKRQFLMYLSASEVFGLFFRDNLRPTSTRICIRTALEDKLTTPFVAMSKLNCGKNVKELVLRLSQANCESVLSCVDDAFDDLMAQYGSERLWQKMVDREREAVMYRLLDQIELLDRSSRLKGIRAFLYVAQGTWGEVQSDEEQLIWSKKNCLLLYKHGVFEAMVQQLRLEIEGSPSHGTSGYKSPVSLSDSFELRAILSILYTMIELLRLPCEGESEDDAECRERMKQELGQPYDDELLAVILFSMITKFCSNNAPRFPMKKVLLLLWKVLFVSLGGMPHLARMKNEKRIAYGLPAVTEDTLEVAKNIRPATPPMYASDMLEHSQAAFSGRGLGGGRGGLLRRGLMKQSSLDDSFDGDNSLNNNNAQNSNQDDDEENVKVDDDAGNNPSNGDIQGADEELREIEERRRMEESGLVPGPPSPRPATPVPHRGKALPWAPKVRMKDVETFLENARLKFFGFPLRGDRASLAGLPKPLHEGLRILQKHMYVSLAEKQIEEEEEVTRHPLSHPEDTPDRNPVEVLYQAMVPSLPQYMIAILKILLAASPTSKTKMDSINIMADVLPEEMPISVMQSMKLGIDVNRQKEIIVMAVSGILLLLLKHLKLNHVYQFEFLSQHLVFANCVPLILKFLNQNISAYVSAKNNVALIDFPSCVLNNTNDLTEENLEIGCSPGGGSQSSDQNLAKVCWRNMASTVNLLRILNKLTKWKHSRIMMLVVFKSAPILKRSLKVRHALLQLYILKLLKMQTKYLGRQWRKGNMKILSAIYSKVRHRLNDDWAFGNDLNARPWDFQADECSLRANVDRFNNRRYGTGAVDPDFEPMDTWVASALAVDIELTDDFKQRYEVWLQHEVFSNAIDWDQLITKPKKTT
ncbi:unnamed protein product [Notodromas monacha]|uniref:Striatin-interacting protein n=1 Tax=Notodromas monacha TaxID=399045 RepID=A0A7R9BGX8_9CRUS|nr:unnamed protein product [Notodromas monacha]CAG0914425.1 unnamed protein product [Notodromas monacha]